MTNFIPGDRVRVHARNSRHLATSKYLGATGTVQVRTRTGTYRVVFDDEALQKGNVGTWTDVALEHLDEAKATRIVATLPHDTARQYADNARSRTLPVAVNDILRDAANGQEVDVVEFRKAATAALSLAATRAGQSMARREWTKQARHLIYWADAIIDQHVQGLPIYEAGARSPKIRSLEETLQSVRDLAEARYEEIQNLRSERASLTEAASAERRRLCAEIDALRATTRDLQGRAVDRENELQEEIHRIAEVAEAQSEKDAAERDGLYRECNEFHAALEYAFTLLGASDQSRLAGFRDGYATRANDVPSVG
jgi:hypothetical protein